MRTLAARVLVGTLAIVLVTAAVTAWMTVRGTTAAISRETDVEADKRVYDALVGFAATHATWQDAPVAELAASTGRRIVLVAESGIVLADSHPGRPREGGPLAVVDPLEVDPMWSRWSQVDPRADGPVPLTPDEVLLQERLTRRAMDCMHARGVEAFAVESWAGSTMLLTERQVLECAPLILSPVLQHRDGGEALLDLEDRIAGHLRGTGLGPVSLDFNVMLWGDGTARWSRGDFLVISDAVSAALEDQVRETVAPPAVLFVSDAGAPVVPRFQPAELATAVMLVLVLAAAVSIVMAHQVSRPLTALTGVVRRMRDGDRAARATVRAGDREVRTLATAFNEMADHLRALEAERAQLLGEVTHELRNPLTNLRGWLEAGHDGVADLDAELLDALVAETRVLQRVVADLHQLNLADAGVLPLERRPVDLPTLLIQVRTAHLPVAAQAGVQILVDVASGTVLADPDRLRQALGNLVANALRHTPHGGTVTLGARRGRGAVRLTVSDDGPGVPPQDLPRLFERFWRAPGTERADGSGLGLAVVRGIARLHGGDVTAESGPGQGLTVTMNLPAP